MHTYSENEYVCKRIIVNYSTIEYDIMFVEDSGTKSFFSNVNDSLTLLLERNENILCFVCYISYTRYSLLFYTTKFQLVMKIKLKLHRLYITYSIYTTVVTACMQLCIILTNYIEPPGFQFPAWSLANCQDIYCLDFSINCTNLLVLHRCEIMIDQFLDNLPLFISNMILDRSCE